MPVFVMTSCKEKEKEAEVLPSISSTLGFNVQSFVLPGQKLEIEPLGLENETMDIGYYWTASPIRTARDTTRCLGDPASVTGKYSFVVPDTLCTITFSCGAFAEGYTTKTATRTSMIVNPGLGKSITDDGIGEGDEIFTDPRDGKEYYYRTIGGREWFVRNLSYAQSGASYYDCPALDDIFGRYYSWNEAVVACPDGWRLPTDEDWLSMVKYAGYSGNNPATDFLGAAGSIMVDAKFNGTRMWEYNPEVKITNRTGFCALPTGYVSAANAGNRYHGEMEYAVWWTSETERIEGDEAERGVYRMINVKKPDIMRGNTHKTGFLATVRCVRNPGADDDEL